MADRLNRRKRWDLGLKSHRQEINNEDKKEKRRMRRMRRWQNQKKKKNDIDNRKLENQAKANEDNSNNGEDDDAHCSILDDDLVVSQILSRLPAKSLMRCKLVCKDWKSIIQHDSNFINLHHTRSQLRPSLFIAVRPRSPNNSNNNNNNKRIHRMRPFFSADLHFDDGGGIAGTTIHRITRGLKSPSEVFKYLGPVNGLLCIVDSHFAVQICNVSTGQATPWINSAVVMSRNHEGPPRCQFGFDPVTGKHKVLYLWHANYYVCRPGREQDRYKEAPVCEVLTVGDTRWRIIDDVPPCEIQRDYNAYVNGSIYWITFRRLGRNVPKSGHSDTLVAFDIGSEKFRMIPKKFGVSMPAAAAAYGVWWFSSDVCRYV
ncbi:F-box protein At3g07870 [Linum perenne]